MDSDVLQTEMSLPPETSAIEPCGSQIVQEWNSFVRSGRKPTHVSESVYKSWTRSHDFEIDPYGGKSRLILSAAELQEKMSNNLQLIDVASGYMHKIHDAIRGMKHLLYLTDADGNILFLLGDPVEKRKFEQHFNFKAGASWGEQAVGTTAVAVALYEKTTIPYMSSAKYCYDLKETSCAAIPLSNNDDEIIGIIGIATHSKELSMQVFWMLVSAQMGVENQFRLQKYEAGIHVINQQFQAIFDSVSDVIVCVDGEGCICDINSTAEDILNLKGTDIQGKRVSEVLDFSPLLLGQGNEMQQCQDGFLRDTRKRMYSLRRRFQRIGARGEENGCVFVFDGHQSAPAKNQLKSAPAPRLVAQFCFDDIIGKAPSFLDVKKEAIVASGSFANVLISGESGTGKEMFAQAIHAAGSRAQSPFIAVNCGAIPKELIESEFLGYEHGAFTGADRKGKIGKFEQANGGTLFLDEIGEMPWDLQVRLLRVLQNRQVTRIGGTRAIDVDVRIIAATNKDMLHEVNMKTFRSDLFWRLNVIDLRLPSLLERREDIRLLVGFFLKKHAPVAGLKYQIDDGLWPLLLAYHWPGNIRELENTVERALVFAKDGIVTIDTLPFHIKQTRYKVHDCLTYHSLGESEKLHIEEVLNENHYNISQTARILGVARNTLYKKINKYHIRCSHS